eukprot:TRINITY_DN1593_c0_g1_i1.p1 TRINITY_DN1593_c0_g1~~TRINITY_DN1593_c0_g1_i1.p1  ORF type:complete len:683 (-),score=147.33 TRINITY_DN1593_c0_g1_i1:167-2215(-)
MRSLDGSLSSAEAARKALKYAQDVLADPDTVILFVPETGETIDVGKEPVHSVYPVQFLAEYGLKVHDHSLLNRLLGSFALWDQCFHPRDEADDGMEVTPFRMDIDAFCAAKRFLLPNGFNRSDPMSNTTTNIIQNLIHGLLEHIRIGTLNMIPFGGIRGIVFLLGFHEIFYEPEHAKLLSAFLTGVARIIPTIEPNLIQCLSNTTKDFFEACLTALQQYVTVQWYVAGDRDASVESCFIVMKTLYRTNGSKRFVSYTSFYNDAANGMEQRATMEHFHLYFQKRGFSVFNYPFLLDPSSKSTLLSFESRMEQHDMARSSMLRRALFRESASPHLVLQVFRENIIPSTLTALSSMPPEDMKKPLKVIFVGEAGVDAGGVQKEFFQIIVRKIFDPSFGMFTYSEETRSFWFNANSLESAEEFRLIGMILGLAIYNQVILDLHFPLIVYKKLLDEETTFEDFKEFDPSVARSMETLLEYEGDDFESVFDMRFVRSEDVFGESREIPLIPGGEQIQVDASNRQTFVQCYVDNIFHTSVERQFRAFQDGFTVVCGGRIMELFHAEELELLICGSPELNFEALEMNTKYHDGYSSSSTVIRWFWEIVHRDMTEEDRKKLLFFVTGSDRVPIKGLGGLDFGIYRNGPDSDRLPTSHTCFNALMLPEYGSKEKLKSFMLIAIRNAEGFGLL